MIRVLVLAPLLLFGVACSRPHVPEKERKVNPKSEASHDDLRRAIDAPLQQARSVQGTLDAADKAQRAQMDRDEGAPAATPTPP